MREINPGSREYEVVKGLAKLGQGDLIDAYVFVETGLELAEEGRLSDPDFLGTCERLIERQECSKKQP